MNPPSPAESPLLELYMSEPRLRMTFFGRLVVRAAGYIWYLVVIAAGITLLISDVPRLRAAGALLALMLIDYVIHAKEADRHLTELPERGRVNVARYLAPATAAALEHAYQRSSLTREHFLLGVALELLGADSVHEGLRRLDVDVNQFKQKLKDLSSAHSGEYRERRDLFLEAEKIAVLAFHEARAREHLFVRPSDLFSALPRAGDELVDRAFQTFSIEPDDLELALILSGGRNSLFSGGRLPMNVGELSFETQRRLRHRVVNRAWTSLATPVLDRYGTDLTDRARQGFLGFLIGHDAEYERLLDVLSRPVNPNALLVGEEGAGKETIVAHLAMNITKDKVPRPLFDKRVVALHVSNLVANASPDEVQGRIEKVIEEIYLAENIVLYIPDIHNLVKTSGSAYLSVADALLPLISNNAFPVIGATYPREFRDIMEKRSDFASSFEVIRVEEVSERDAQKLLAYECLVLERQSKCTISFAAVKEAVRLAKKFFHERLLPSSAAALLKDGVLEAVRRGEKRVGAEEIVRAAERKVNVPIHEATEKETEKLLKFEALVHERFVDQDEAVKAVGDALREYRSGLTKRRGPIAVFLFVGPTGVGKTELSKIIADLQFGSERAMVRFDMSEYQERQSLYRFIGSPEGSLSGSLTEAVRKSPYSLILLDEFEKAHPDILNLFLQVFDEGRLTDNLERVIDFKDTILIATSNAHSDIVLDALRHGEPVSSVAEYLKTKLTDVFRAELLNRFSRIVVFRDLSPKDMRRIAEIQLSELARTLEEQGVSLVWDENVVAQVSSLGYDPAFGARPLRRVVEERIRAPLAGMILRKEITKGERVTLASSGGEFQFEKSER
ncbi:MAG: ATP-dependent Clp protease ATP-binding subunit [Candidatus Liptonbacteria bacterium]|nr:ATP-dependent Clp protease ATP-binding subunit [Candidatus Liptonbacteria bacterium]